MFVGFVPCNSLEQMWYICTAPSVGFPLFMVNFVNAYERVCRVSQVDIKHKRSTCPSGIINREEFAPGFKNYVVQSST